MGSVKGPHTRTLCGQRKRAAGPGRTPEERVVGGGRVPEPGHQPETGTETRGASPPPPPTYEQQSKGLEQETRRGTNHMDHPYQRPARGPREERAQQDRGRWLDANTAGARAQKRTTDTWRAPEGQPDRARGMHRPHGPAYQQARARDIRTGQPATSTGRDAREGQQGGGEMRRGTGPALLTCRERRTNTNRALHSPRQ